MTARTLPEQKINSTSTEYLTVIGLAGLYWRTQKDSLLHLIPVNSVPGCEQGSLLPSHSHRGFSRCSSCALRFSNRFNGFLIEPQPFDLLQTVKTVSGFVVCFDTGLKPRCE